SDVFGLQNMSLVDRAARAGIQIGAQLTPEQSQLLSISGYTGHHPELVQQLVKNFAGLDISETEFAQVLDRFTLDIINARKLPPFRQMFAHRNRLIREVNWTDEEILAQAKKLT